MVREASQALTFWRLRAPRGNGDIPSQTPAMLYLSSAQLLEESFELGIALGRMPPTFVRPQVNADSILELEPLLTLPYKNLKLFLATHTASWCLLDSFEAAVAMEASGVPFTSLCARYPGIGADQLKGFFIRLYQRGLLRIDSEPGLDPDVLSDGALFREANLVEVLVTQKCNLACLYCLAGAGPDMPHLHPEFGYKAVDEAFRLRKDIPLGIQLSGGEPFVNFKLFRALVEYIEEKRQTTGRDVAIVTQSNGTLINDEIAEFIKAHGIRVGISIDGPSHLNNRSRPLLGGGPSHERTLRGIQTLQRHGIDFGAILVLNSLNVGYPQEIADYSVELGIKSIKINPVNMIGDAQTTWDSVAITSDEYFTFLTSFIDHIIQNRLPLREANLAEYLKYLVRRVHDYRCMRSNCGAGKSFFLVDAMGDVYPCAHSAGIPEWRIGTIQEADGDLVKLGERNAIVDLFHERRVERMSSTQACPWRHFCEGGCAVNAHQKFGTILAPDTLCAFYERMYPRLFEMLAATPERFQTLLHLTFGPGQADVVVFRLVPNNQAGAAWSKDREEVSQVRYHSDLVASDR